MTTQEETTPERRDIPHGEEFAIDASQVTKLFGEHRAVNDVSFQIKRGEVVGFLGPNGSGKTTTMRMITSFYTPDIGNIKIKGLDTLQHDIETRKFMGYLPENNPLYGDLLVSEYLNFVADLRGLTGVERQRNIDLTVEETGLNEYYYKLVNTLSKGYRQRTGLAGAILHRPDILIMDEPTEGLDPNQRITIRELIKRLGEERTIMLSTHVLREIEGTCNRVLLINRGKLVLDATTEEMYKLVRSSASVNVQVQGKNIEKALARLPGINLVTSKGADDEGERFSLEHDGQGDLRPEIFKLAKKNNWVLWELHEQQPNLEDVFREFTVDVEKAQVQEQEDAAQA